MPIYDKPNQYDQCLYKKYTDVLAPPHLYSKTAHRDLRPVYETQHQTAPNPMEKPMPEGKK